MSSTSLFVFDFDHTVVDCNTDTIIYNLLENKKLPEEVEKQYDGKDWNRFMQIVFDYLNYEKITKEQIYNVMKTAPFTKGFLDIFTHLKGKKSSVIIASDSNTEFIETILKNQKIDDVFTGVFTNPAQFQGEQLKISPYEIGHGCSQCRPNMCKSKIIQDFIKLSQSKGQTFSKVVFVGDGGNDLCPIKNNIAHVAFVRKGFILQKLVGKLIQTKCELHFWENGNQILSVIQKW